ncbi:MAG: ABC transporter permease [Parafilimonas sp.]
MFKNYLKTAWRNIRKNKAFSFINIVGLAIGIAASLLLFIIVEYELGYDSFQKDYNHIYRVVTQNKYADGITYNDGTAAPALAALRTSFPQIKFSGIVSTFGSQVTVDNNKKFVEQTGIFFCEQQFFNVFQYKWLDGNAASLSEPNTVVLSKSTAEKYFGNAQHAVGKTIRLDNDITLKVSGIIANPPANSDFPLSVLISYETFKSNPQYGYNDAWGSISSNVQVYALFPSHVNGSTINKQLATFSKEHYTQGISKTINFLEPLKDLHYDTRFSNFNSHVTSKSTLWTLSLIGIFILLMACINFINLSTAQAVNRSKEVGIRKVVGSSRSQLFYQLMGETGMIVFIALLIGILMAYIALPYTKHVASIPEPLSLFTVPSVLILAAIAIAVTFLAGTYPSLIMSRFNPLTVLKNKKANVSAKGISLRRSLVVIQFAISQVLIIATIIAVSQMNFVQHADLGFNKDAVLMLSQSTDSTALARLNAFKQKLLTLNGVQSVSLTNDAPSSDNNWSTGFAFDHGANKDFQIHLKFGDADYIKTFGLQLIAGRTYSESDTARELVVNETLLKMLHISNPKDILGKDIQLSGKWLPVVGVVKDFKDHSLRSEIKPIVLTTDKTNYGETAIKLHSSNIGATKAAIEKTWNEFYPDYTYSADFLDETIAHFYDEEEHLSVLYKIFAGLAIFISCLGLYGLISFMTIQKTKEVGIRKVLGASVSSIIYMFSKEFTFLTIISFFIAAPVAWYAMSNWLNNFVYRVPLSISFFIVAAIASIVIAWITVGYKAIKAAIANPVKSLRTE